MTDSQELASLLDRWSTDEPDADLAAAVATAAAHAAAGSDGNPELWQRFLETTGAQPYLAALADRNARYAWAETAFTAIRRAEFGLAALLDWRVRERGDTIFLRALGRTGEPALPYRQVARRTRRIAAHLLGAEPSAANRPVVGILAANTLDGALCDLACLVHDIPVVPLNIHEDTATLAWICDRLAIGGGIDYMMATIELKRNVPFINPYTQSVVDVAEAEGADAVAHGCTGKG